MKSYFKYTTGEAFTLDGEDYSGFFTLWKGIPITGKIPSDTSGVLSSKGNMLANSFLNKRNFDRTAAPVSMSNRIIAPEISPRDIIDQRFLNKNLNILNHNNLNLFGLNIIPKTNLIDLENTHTDGDSYFLGVSSGKTDTKNNDTGLAKTNSRPLQIDPFAATNRLPAGINALDSKVDGTLFVNDDKSYKYLITTNTNSYTFSGSFAPKGSLTLIDEGKLPAGSKLTYNDTTGELINYVCLHGPVEERLHGLRRGGEIEQRADFFTHPDDRLPGPDASVEELQEWQRREEERAREQKRELDRQLEDLHGTLPPDDFLDPTPPRAGAESTLEPWWSRTSPLLEKWLKRYEEQLDRIDKLPRQGGPGGALDLRRDIRREVALRELNSAIEALWRLVSNEQRRLAREWAKKQALLEGQYGTPRDRNKTPGNRPVPAPPGLPPAAGMDRAPAFPPDLRFEPSEFGAERGTRELEWWDPSRGQWIPKSQEPMPDPWPFWWEGDLPQGRLLEPNPPPAGIGPSGIPDVNIRPDAPGGFGLPGPGGGMPLPMGEDGFPDHWRRGRGWVPLPAPGGPELDPESPGFGLEAGNRPTIGEPEPPGNREKNLKEWARRKKILEEYDRASEEWKEVATFLKYLIEKIKEAKKQVLDRMEFDIQGRPMNQPSLNDPDVAMTEEEQNELNLIGIAANATIVNAGAIADLAYKGYLRHPTFSTVTTPDVASLAANILGTEGFHSHNDNATFMPCYTMDDFMYITNPAKVQEEMSHVANNAPRKYLVNTYDFSSFATTNECQLKDQVPVIGNIVDGKIKVGKNIMGTLHKRGQEIELSISNRYTRKNYVTIVTLGMGDKMVDFDIRDTDDNILILTQNSDSSNTYGLYHVDTDNVLQNSINFNADENQTGKGRTCKCKNEIKVHYLAPNGKDIMIPPDDLNDIGSIPEGWTIEYGFNPSDDPEGLWWRKEGKHCWYRQLYRRGDGVTEIRYYCRDSVNGKDGPLKQPMPDNREWEWDKGDWGRFRMGDGAGGEVDPDAPEQPEVIYTNPAVIIIGGGLDEGEDQIFIPAPDDGDEIIGLPPSANLKWHEELENWEEEWPEIQRNSRLDILGEVIENLPEFNFPEPGDPDDQEVFDLNDLERPSDEDQEMMEESARVAREFQLEFMLQNQIQEWLDPEGELQLFDPRGPAFGEIQEIIENLRALGTDRVLLDSAKGNINRIDTGRTHSHKTKIEFSNTDSNEFILTDNGVVSKGFISNPTFPSSMGSKANLLYPPGAFWGTTEEEISNSQLKWNTDSLKSNNFNNLNIHEVQNQTDTFTFIHNIGRIYLGTSKTLYNNLVPLDLDNNYRPTLTPESSLGISLNSQLQSILKDTLNVFYNLNTVIKQDIVEGIPILQNYEAPLSININLKDFEFHENEEISYTTVSRVFNKLYQLQLDIYNTVLRVSPRVPTEITFPVDEVLYDTSSPEPEDPGPSLYDIYSSWTAPMAHLRYQSMGLAPWPWPPGADLSKEERVKMLAAQAEADRNMDTGPWPLSINQDALDYYSSRSQDGTAGTSTGTMPTTTPTGTTDGPTTPSTGYGGGGGY